MEDKPIMHERASAGKFPWLYFGLVFVLAVPFWIFGEQKLPMTVNLPVSALAFVVPALAAMVYAYRLGGQDEVDTLVRRAVDLKQIKNKLWLAVALGLMPLIFLLAYALMRLLNRPLPPVEISWVLAPVYLVMYWISAVGEELGWTATATDPLQERWSALKGGLLLGLIWAVWHLPPFFHTGNSPEWIFWQSIYTILSRVVMVWLYNKSGKSVLAVILLHAVYNTCWSLFPNDGSHYDPFVMSLVTGLVLAVILMLWDARTFSRFRFGKSSKTA